MADRPGRLSLSWFADQFAEIEKKDRRVVEVRMRSIPPDVELDAVDRRRGKVTMWRADVVIDRRLKAGEVVLKSEEFKGWVPSKKFHTTTLKPKHSSRTTRL